MSYEIYKNIWQDYTEGRTIRPCKTGAEFEFELDGEENKRYRLFTVGETAQFYQWKNEPDAHFQYALLTDSLDTEHAEKSQYCLNFSSERFEPYVKRIYKKILWKPVLSYLKMATVPECWRTGFFASSKDLKIDREKGGYLHMSVEIRYLREGISRHSNRFSPDKTVVIDFAEGSYDMTEFSSALTIDPERTASVAVWIEGKEYSGEVYLERPFLTSSTGFNLLPDFSLPVHEKEKFVWLGQNFSRKEWPEFRVKLNGETVFEGEIFERCHVDSEWEIKLPSNLLKGHNTLSYELISDYHDPMPYTIHEVGIIESERGTAVLVSATETAKVGGRAYILVRTEKEGVSLSLDCPKEYISAPESLYFEEAGLHGIKLDCLKAGTHIRFAIKGEGVCLEGEIERIAEGEDDRVITGTGDMVYILQGLEETEEYLAWYLSNHVGNMITVRPTYRWSGSRALNSDVWKLFTRLMNECSIKYVIMTDGREPVGLNANPDDSMLAGENYLGRQSHEIDGALFYWGIRPASNTAATEQYTDMFTRIYEEDREHSWSRYSPERYVVDTCGENTYLYRDPTVPRDMKIAAERAVGRMAPYQNGEYTRHTGPSVFFKYFIQAGLDWVGAETMYSTMEVLMSFLRGAKDSYRLPAVGVHHATQWSSSPHDAEEHFRRYRLALYVSYMLGADDINTEEGLWRLEEYYSHFHRFTRGCLGHTEQQKDFYRYLSSHTRKGSFYTPMALIHGRYDGWIGFGRISKVWGLRAAEGMPDTPYTDAEQSWDLFKAFYPLSRPGESLYFHDCPADRPMGYHSGTPVGQVDTIPIEKPRLENTHYKTLAFMGYNCAEEKDMQALAEYVKRGGKLILTRAHTTHTTDIEDIRSYRLEYKENPFSFADGEPQFIENTYGGEAVSVCGNSSADGREVLCLTDQGLPLVCRYRLGQGEVILFNVNAYPAHKAIRPLYEKLLRESMTELADREYAWAETDDDVEFAVYDTDEGERHIYLIAVDWYRDPELLRKAVLRVGGHKYCVEMPFGRMIKCVIKGDTLVYPHSENGEVLSVCDGKARVQGEGRVTFTVCKNGKTADFDLDFKEPVIDIEII